MDELFTQTRAVFVADPVEAKKFPKQIAFNVIPHIDVFMDDGYTKEEWKMVVETKKILDPEDQADRHLRARAGVHRPFGGGQHRVREPDHGRRGARDPARGAGLPGDRQARARRLHHAASKRPARTPPTSRRIREDPTVDNGLAHVGASPTTCARARRSTPCRSPRCWSTAAGNSRFVQLV